MPNVNKLPLLTDTQKKILLSHLSDYMLFGIKEQEMIDLLSEKIGRPISESTLYKLKRQVRAKQGSAGEWLDKYAREQLADFYRQRIEELQLLQANLFLILDQEKSKGLDKMNVYRYNTIAKTIIENSRVLSEYGMAPPIISKIKELLPVDINELNNRVNRQKALTNDAININEEDVIEVDTLNENEQSELERIQAIRKTAKSAFKLHSDDQNARGSSGEHQSNPDSQDDRVF